MKDADTEIYTKIHLVYKRGCKRFKIPFRSNNWIKRNKVTILGAANKTKLPTYSFSYPPPLSKNNKKLPTHNPTY